MKRLLALINWPQKDPRDNAAEELDLTFTIDSYQTEHRPERDTQPMVRIGNRDPKDVQKVLDLAG